jgi:hypothetical protein
MPVTPQEVDLDISSTYDVAASAKDADGNDVALHDLNIVVAEGNGVDVGFDADPTDNNDDITTTAEVGAVTLLTATALDENDEVWEAVARTTNKEPIVDQPRVMTLTFTKRVPIAA